MSNSLVRVLQSRQVFSVQVRWLLAMMVAAGALMCWGNAVAEPIPAYADVVEQFRASDVRVLDRRGQLLQRVRTDYRGRRGDWIALEDISPALKDAVIRAEDQRFYAHRGVDWWSVAGAMWQTLFRGGRRGASTISMQLVGLLDTRHQRGSGGRTYTQKLHQVRQARSIEQAWSKPQILESYLNLVSFYGELVGVDALSRVLFQKHASGLDSRESALAAVLLRAPNVSHATLTRRTCTLLTAMDAAHQCDGLADFIFTSLSRRSAPWADNTGLAPHFARWVVATDASTPSLAQAQSADTIVTSIDARLQRTLSELVNRHLLSLRRSNVRDAAVVVLDNQTGQVLAYIGSSGDLSQSAWVDHAQALRQSGSTLKPFLYAQALAQQRITSASLLHDAPLNLATVSGLYRPQNYDASFSGWVSVRTALASSLNIPAVRVLMMVTPEAFQHTLLELGLPLDQLGDFYGYSLALGSADVTLLTLTNAYRALANQGMYSPVLTQPLGVSSVAHQRVMPAAATWVVGDILSDRHARARTFGLDSPLTTPFWTAVKTGTSKDMRDNWSVGWSAHYTVGVWAGNSSGDSMHDVSGVTGAGPIWHDIMRSLHEGLDSKQPAPPSDVTAESIMFDDEIEPARIEFFIGDTVISRIRRADTFAADARLQPLIAEPAAQTVLALDPDIPPANQQVWFRAARADSLAGNGGVYWRLNKQNVGTGQEVSWTPRPGKHEVELMDAEDNTLDSITLEVRGAQEVFTLIRQ